MTAGGERPAGGCPRCGTGLRPFARFCDTCGAAQPGGPAGPVEPGGERRQVTIVFCDVVESTALAERLDPEELRDLLDTYHTICAREIGRFGGAIGKLLGDGVLAYFGYPAAQDNDAQAAVGAALSIVRHMRERESGDIAVRVGIHSGLVVTGGLGAPEQREWTVLGSAPNIAARLQGLASPNTVVVSGATLRLVEGFFDLRAFGPQALRGLATPIEVYEVLGPRAVYNRVEAALGVGHLTPLVGRREAIETLAACWDRAREGDGQVALASGDAGIGKSRLLHELWERVADDGALRLECRCTAYHQHSALYPVIDLFQRLWQLKHADSPAVLLERLERGAAPCAAAVPHLVPLLAALLSVPLPHGRYETPNLTPQRQRQLTLEALCAIVVAMARETPVLLAVEDAHWIDASSLELITQLLERLPAARILLVLLHRPSFQPPDTVSERATRVALDRLSVDQAAEMVQLVSGDRSLPRQTVADLCARAEGVPLFVEELTKTVLEAGLVERDGGRVADVAIPLTLQESLMARLDRLAPVKDVVQMSATLGRAFTYDMLHAVSSLDEMVLRSELGRLVDAEVLHVHGVPPHETYVFKHVLIQEAAYETILRHKRRDLHALVVRAFETEFPELVATQPEVLAHHCTHAGQAAEAVAYYVRAGLRAIERSACVEATAHLRAGEALIPAVPEASRSRCELEVLIRLGPALVATQGFASPEVERVYARARELCEGGGDPRQLFAALGGLHVFHQSRAELAAGLPLARARLDLAARLAKPGLVAQVYESEATLRFWRGDHAESLRAIDAAFDHYDPVAARRLALEYGTEVGVVCGAYAAQVLWFLGRPDEAVARMHEAVALARTIGHANTLGLALDFGASLHALRRDVPETLRFADEAIAFSGEQQLPFWLGFGTIFRGWALTHLSRIDEGIALMLEGIRSFQGTGALIGGRLCVAMLAEAYLRAGQVEVGRDLLAVALPGLERCEDRFFDAEVLRVQAELVLNGGVPDRTAAERLLGDAVALARRQGSRGLELRAAISLARLWMASRRDAEAHALLAPCRAFFTQGTETGDVREADAVLDALGCRRVGTATG
jgi:class 3 adenylate cyclase/predicted ATPase